jgi:alpha-glucuronidase
MQGVATTNDLIYEYEELAAELDAERQKILTRLQTLQDSSRNWQQIEKDMKI